MNLPIKIDKNIDKLCKDAKSLAGREFYKYNLGAREFIKKKLDEIKIPNAETFFKIYFSEEKLDLWVKAFIDFCKALGIKELKLSKEIIWRIIHSADTPWKYHFDTVLYIFYRRAFLSTGHGKKSNPGGFDLEQCVYLCWADIFVLRDSAFYNFLSELCKLRKYAKKILNYSEFKSYLDV